MSSLFSLMPSAPGLGVLIVAGFKVEHLPLANLAQSVSQRHQESHRIHPRALCARKASMFFRPACKRFTITALIRFKSS